MEDKVMNEEDQIREMTMQTDAFGFWEDEAEDLYQHLLHERKDE